MKRTDKTTYTSPVCEVVECRLQGVLAASKDDPMGVLWMGSNEPANYNEGIVWGNDY